MLAFVDGVGFRYSDGSGNAFHGPARTAQKTEKGGTWGENEEAIIRGDELGDGRLAVNF